MFHFACTYFSSCSIVQYLNTDYVERLQSIVSNKLHEKHVGDPKEAEKAKATKPMVDSLCQTSEPNLNVSFEAASKSLNADRMDSLLVPNELDQPQSRTPKSPSTNLVQRKRVTSSLKPEVSTTISRQPELDTIETSLAKITCSQRAICTSIDSLV